MRPGTAVEYNVGLLVAVGTIVNEAEIVQASGVGRNGKRNFVRCVGEAFYISGA